MYQSLDKNLLSALEEKEEEAFPIARIIEEGRDKGFVTLDDIMQQFPEAERSVDQLEEVFAALLSAGIPYIEDAPEEKQLDEEEPSFDVDEGEEPEEAEDTPPINDDYLAHIEINDTVGLYLKEAGRVPLLTHEQEVEITQRIERGREAMSKLAQGNVKSEERENLRWHIQDGKFFVRVLHLVLEKSKVICPVDCFRVAGLQGKFRTRVSSSVFLKINI